MIVILYFHSIGFTPLSYSPSKFDWLIKSLIENDYKSIKLNQINQCNPENNYFVLTFDDCFKDVLINAIPIMLKYGVTGTFFPVVEYLNKILYGSVEHLKWSEEKSSVYDLEFNFMNLQDLKYLLNLDMEIGNHTFSHLNLIDLDGDLIQQEIEKANIFWMRELNYIPTTFCYPRGKYNLKIINILSNSHLKRACTTKIGYYDNISQYEIPRFFPPVNRYQLKSLLNGRSYKLTFFDKLRKLFKKNEK
jgi:peptidoglycan/xylan/chitin deacetylase (PgdA/CDA1 family)